MTDAPPQLDEPDKPNWARGLVIGLGGLVLAMAMALVGLGIIAHNLDDVADDLDHSARRQEQALDDLAEVVDGQAAAAQRSECLTGEYKEFFAGVAQALYAFVSDGDPSPEAVDRLQHAAEVLPNIDDLCAPDEEPS